MPAGAFGLSPAPPFNGMSAIGDIVQSSVDRIFNVLGEAATYTPDGGSPTSITVIPVRDHTTLDLGQSRVTATKGIFEVRVSEVATPKRNDTVTFGGSVYKVSGEPVYRDPRRLIWNLDTIEQ